MSPLATQMSGREQQQRKECTWSATGTGSPGCCFSASESHCVIGDAWQNLLVIWSNIVVNGSACLLICDIYNVEKQHYWACIDIYLANLMSGLDLNISLLR